MAPQQHRIVTEGPLHDGRGHLKEPGYATSLLLHYNRARVKTPTWRIKEWDYYLINDDEYAVALTLGDLGYMGLVSASVIDLGAQTYVTASVTVPFPMGSFKLPPASSGGISEYENARAHLRFEVREGVRKLRAVFKRFDGDDTLEVDALLDEEPDDSMVIATPWAEYPLAFYYNQKIVGMRAQGSFKKGQELHGFRPEDSFGLLDWGRGVWTRDNTWFWSAAQGWQDGIGGAGPNARRFGFNLGYGFGDPSAATENAVFLDGVAHKVGTVEFLIPEKADHPRTGKRSHIGDRYNLMASWRIIDDEGKLDLTFTPLVDRKDFVNLGIIVSDQHQVFGTFEGKVVCDGEPFMVSGLKGFAEVVRNRY